MGFRGLGNVNAEKMAVARFVGLRWDEMLGVLRDCSCSQDVLRAGVVDKHWEARRAAVENPNAPEDVIRAGAVDKSSLVREAAVRHLSAPEDVIRAGAEDDDPWVRKAAAGSPKLIAELAEKLSRTEWVAIQQALVENSVVPERIRVVARMKVEAGRR